MMLVLQADEPGEDPGFMEDIESSKFVMMLNLWIKSQLVFDGMFDLIWL